MGGDAVHVLGLSGSLRNASYNTGLLRAASELLPEGMTMEIFDLSPIPFYNADVEAEGMPAPVQQLQERITAADALLIATPEYNGGIPGVLKNAIDWASRASKPTDSPLYRKPMAMMGGGGGRGTPLAQSQLRILAAGTNMIAMTWPIVSIPAIWNMCDEQGNVTDEGTRKQIASLLQALKQWAIKLQ